MAEADNQAPLPKKRVVRVFVSSTFKDMQAERDELVKRVFPQLRKLCEERSVTWSEIDLRWGITQEQSEQHKVLPICLERIDSCRPYFICMLGERYGWIIDEIPGSILNKHTYSWLADQHEKSVTELEILHGALNDPALAKHAYFYFRDPHYAERLPPDQRADFVDVIHSNSHKLSALKDRIRASGLPVRESYTDPESFGLMVLEDFTRVIDEEFPATNSPIDSLNRENSAHEVYVQRQVGEYVKRQADVKRLDEHIASASPPLIITGDIGAGKSALLSNWLITYRENYQNIPLVAHYVTASPAGNHWMSLVHHVLSEINRQTGLNLEIPRQPQALREAFANGLSLAAQQGPFILMLDGLSQIDNQDGGQELTWLPSEIPSQLRLIVSSRPGTVLDTLVQRNWEMLNIQPLTTDERKYQISVFLDKYGKAITQQQIDQIASQESTANPLYLRTFLEELRTYGDHATLQGRIEYYLEANSLDTLYARILERFDHDFDRDRPDLVADAMSFIWASRQGLSENQILELLGTREAPLPQAFWSPFYLNAESFLFDNSGYIQFFHDSFRDAVQARYLVGIHQQQHYSLTLADYLQSAPLSHQNINELLWQLLQSQSWQRLYDLLSTPSLIDYLSHHNLTAVLAYWSQLEANSSFRAVDAYRLVIEDPECYKHILSFVSQLLYNLGYIHEAQALWEFEVEYFRKSADQLNTAAALQNLSASLIFAGDTQRALQTLRDAEQMWRSVNFTRGLASTLNNQALIYISLGKRDEAYKLLQEAEVICKNLDDHIGLINTWANQALILRFKGKLDDAMRLHRQEEQLARQMDQQEALARSLFHQATILRLRGDLQGALALVVEVEQKKRLLGDKEGLQAALGNQAIFLINLGEFDRALALAREQEQLCREIGFKDGLARSLGNQAQALICKGQPTTALTLYREVEQLARDLNNPVLLQGALGNQAVLLDHQGDLRGAKALYREDELLCRQTGNMVGLRDCLMNQGLLAQREDNLTLALELFNQAEAIGRHLNTPIELARCLMLKARLLAIPMIRPREAVPLIREAYQLAVGAQATPLVDQIKRVWSEIETSLLMP